MAHGEVVVVEADGAGAVAAARDVQDPGADGQLGHDQVGEEEVADVVDAEVHLQPLGRLAVGHGGDGGVVDEQVDGVFVGVDLGGGGADLGLVGEVEGEDAGGRAFGEGGGEGLGFLGGAAGQDEESRGVRGEGGDEGGAEGAWGDAGDEYGLAGDVVGQVCCDLFGGSFARVGGGHCCC